MSTDKLTEHEVKQVKNMIESFAVSPGGLVQSTQIGNIMRSLFLIPSETEVAEIGQVLDPIGQGLIQQEQIFGMIVELWPSSTEAIKLQLWNAFKYFDKQESGRIHGTILGQILSDIGTEPLSKNEVKKILKKFVNPKDGSVIYGDIIRYWTT